MLSDRAFTIAINRKYDGYQRGIPLMVYNFIDKKVEDTSLKKEAAIYENQELGN